MSRPTRTDPAQRAAMATVRYIKKYLWTIRDEKGNFLGLGTLGMEADSLACHLVVPIRRALRKKPRQKGAK